MHTKQSKTSLHLLHGVLFCFVFLLIGSLTGSADPRSRVDERVISLDFAPFCLIIPLLYLSHTQRKKKTTEKKQTTKTNVSKNKIKIIPSPKEKWNKKLMTMSKWAKKELFVSCIAIVVLRQHKHIFIQGGRIYTTVSHLGKTRNCPLCIHTAHLGASIPHQGYQIYLTHC